MKQNIHYKHQIKEHTLLYLFISLIDVVHPLKTSSKRTHIKFKIDQITYSKSQSRATYDISKNKPLLYP